MSGQNDVVFDLDSAAFSNLHWRLYCFKVKKCPRVTPHDFAGCPFAHSGEKAKRRDPRMFKYSGTACPEFRRNGCCRRADACPFAHGIFECWMHPSRYRTQMCSEVLECKRRVCFFAHTEDELRKPIDDSTWMNQHPGNALDTDLGNAPLDSFHHQAQAPRAEAPAAAPPADLWAALQQMVSNGALDASQLLQVMQVLGPQNIPATNTNATRQGPAGSLTAPDTLTMTGTPEKFIPSLPTIKSRPESSAGAVPPLIPAAADGATGPASPLISTSVRSTSEAPEQSEPTSPDRRSSQCETPSTGTAQQTGSKPPSLELGDLPLPELGAAAAAGAEGEGEKGAVLLCSPVLAQLSSSGAAGSPPPAAAAGDSAGAPQKEGSSASVAAAEPPAAGSTQDIMQALQQLGLACP